MKKVFLFTAFIGLVLGVNAQDTLKLKTIKTYYGEPNPQLHSYTRIGDLDGAVLYTDSLVTFYPEMRVLNISDDVYPYGTEFQCVMEFHLHADTGVLMVDRNVSAKHPIDFDFTPDDIASLGFMAFPLMGIVNEVEQSGINLSQISYWKLITGISFTSKDGTYSDKVFYEGADTSIFYIVKGGVGIEEMKQNFTSLSLFPNPATTQLTLDNKDALIKEVHIYDVTGREVSRHSINANQRTLDISTLKSGLYIVKIHTEQGVLNRKVQVVK